MIATLLLLSCGGPADPLGALDAEYVEIRAGLAIADRDTSRNVQNKEARARKIEHEQARVAFFSDGEVAATIDEARKSSDPTTAWKGEAYWREALLVRSWTEAEKERETELLAAIEDLRHAEATWSTEEGTEIALNGRWESVSEGADTLSADERAELAAAWTSHRVVWIGSDLEELVRLRNEVARREGFDTYWELALAHRGLTPEQVDELDASISALVTPHNTRRAAALEHMAKELELPLDFANAPLLGRRAGLTLDRTETDAWFDSDLAEERVTTALGDLGISTEGLQLYIGPTRYARSGAYSFPIRPPQHAAVVLSNDTRWSDWPYRGLLHEVGLAIWWRSLPADHASSPVTWQPPTPWFEGFGDFFERMLFDELFLATYVPEVPEESRAVYAASRVQGTIQTLSWYLGCTRAERMLYERPGEWEAISAQLAGQERALRGEHFDAPPGDIAYTSFLQSGLMLNYPAYVQNFLFSSATEARLWEAATEAVGHPVANPKLGPWVVDLVHSVGPGKSFEQRLDELSGGDRTDALQRYLSGG
ncbi:MAG TPA: hypothetical protein QGF58_07555 [Myxococcota bacterium]|nr:hypothetical protein [Myxococcota bacterium]